MKNEEWWSRSESHKQNTSLKRSKIHRYTFWKLKSKENQIHRIGTRKNYPTHRPTSCQGMATKINPNCPPDRRWKLRTINTSFAAFLIAPLCGRTVWISSWKIIHRRCAALPWVSRSEKYRGTKRQLSCCVMHVSQWALTAEFVPRRRRFLLAEDTEVGGGTNIRTVLHFHHDGSLRGMNDTSVCQFLSTCFVSSSMNLWK